MTCQYRPELEITGENPEQVFLRIYEVDGESEAVVATYTNPNWWLFATDNWMVKLQDVGTYLYGDDSRFPCQLCVRPVESYAISCTHPYRVPDEYYDPLNDIYPFSAARYKVLSEDYVIPDGYERIYTTNEFPGGYKIENLTSVPETNDSDCIDTVVSLLNETLQDGVIMKRSGPDYYGSRVGFTSATDPYRVTHQGVSGDSCAYKVNGFGFPPYEVQAMLRAEFTVCGNVSLTVQVPDSNEYENRRDYGFMNDLELGDHYYGWLDLDFRIYFPDVGIGENYHISKSRYIVHDYLRTNSPADPDRLVLKRAVWSVYQSDDLYADNSLVLPNELTLVPVA